MSISIAGQDQTLQNMFRIFTVCFKSNTNETKMTGKLFNVKKSASFRMVRKFYSANMSKNVFFSGQCYSWIILFLDISIIGIWSFKRFRDIFHTTCR